MRTRLFILFVIVLSLGIVAGCGLSFSPVTQVQRQIAYDYSMDIEYRELVVSSGQGSQADLLSQYREALYLLLSTGGNAPFDQPDEINVSINGMHTTEVSGNLPGGTLVVENSTTIDDVLIWEQDLGISEIIKAVLSGGPSSGVDLSVAFDRNGFPTSYSFEGQSGGIGDLNQLLGAIFPPSFLFTLYLGENFQPVALETGDTEISVTLPNTFGTGSTLQISLFTTIEEVNADGTTLINVSATISPFTINAETGITTTVDYSPVTMRVLLSPNLGVPLEMGITAESVRITSTIPAENTDITTEFGFSFSSVYSQ